MKVMFLANNDAGLYKFRQELLKELVKEHEVFLCIPDGEYVENMVEMGCKFIPCNCLERQGTNPLKDLQFLYIPQGIPNTFPTLPKTQNP